MVDIFTVGGSHGTILSRRQPFIHIQVRLGAEMLSVVSIETSLERCE